MTLRVLVTGASGYIGGRLVPELLAAGHRVRALSRDATRLRDAPWAGQVEIVAADALDPVAFRSACTDIEVVYYLVHSLGIGPAFSTTDAAMARTVAAAAREAGVRRIVYLGALADDEEQLSAHLASRREVGEILLRSGVPTAVLQAAVIIGSGSLSFEMLRYLTERLPVMVTPKWVRSRIQPIAVRDVLRYLVGCAALPPTVNRRFDIGGPDILTYADMMRGYARVAGLPPRIIVPTPLLSPQLSAHWINIVTPVPGALAKPLITSLVNTVVCREHDLARFVPDPPAGLVPFEEAVRLALARVRDADVQTRWSSARWPAAPSDPLPTDPQWSGGSVYTNLRERPVAATPAQLWRVIESIGGENGWYSFPLAWSVRGLLDRLVGGAGLRRGRRDPERLRVGESLDWWRVEEIVPAKLLRLRAEMRVPGAAWLELGIRQEGDTVVYVQRALFHPRGLAGQLYWWAVSPFHGLVFGGMLRNITATAQRRARLAELPRPAG